MPNNFQIRFVVNSRSTNLMSSLANIKCVNNKWVKKLRAILRSFSIRLISHSSQNLHDRTKPLIESPHATMESFLHWCHIYIYIPNSKNNLLSVKLENTHRGLAGLVSLCEYLGTKKCVRKNTSLNNKYFLPFVNVSYVPDVWVLDN